MAGIQHLSMRAPWRDRPWDQFLCDDPLGNSSCTLLAAIGKRRDDDTGEERQLIQALLGLPEERRRTRDVCGHDIETSRLDQREHGRLLDAGERGQRHGSSPITATAGPLRTLSRKPEGAANSASVRIVGFTGRCTAASIRAHAS